MELNAFQIKNMLKKNILLIFFVAIFSQETIASDVPVKLLRTGEAYMDLVGNSNRGFYQHIEYGDLLMNGVVIGNYRIHDSQQGGSMRSGDIYLEANGAGYLFIKFMTSSVDPNLFEGIITGGTGNLQRYKGLASGNLPEEVSGAGSVILHLQ